jgi:selenocysteine-specific elongation factor
MIVATAGHVDHGKTSLVKNLSGVDTDNLDEEKRRGLSINLGYAYLQADADTTIGFIDVPGHSRFINTMIAGVSSIDLALIIVAADEGLMPQTIEHIEVLSLLNISQYVVVISHIDRVEAVRAKEVVKSVQEKLGLRCPVFEVNNLNGAGIDNLKKYLVDTAKQQKAKCRRGYFRLSIDRSFLLKGIGLVVTGTAISGMVAEGDKLFLLPDNREVRVRGIHSQNKKSATGRIGQRCALQLTGVEKSQIARGDWLHASAHARVSDRLNVRLEVSDHLPFKVKHLCPVKVYIGAKLHSAKLYLLERHIEGNELAAGDRALAQLIIDGQISICKGDRFILRDSSESVTLGGGVVLEPFARHSSKLSGLAKEYLLAMALPTLEETLRELVIEQQRLVNLNHFKQACNLLSMDLQAVIDQAGLADKSRAFSLRGQEYLVANQYWANAEKSIIDFVQYWHFINPSADGIEAGYLFTCLVPKIDHDLYWTIVNNLIARAVLSRANGCISLKKFKPQISSLERQQWQLIEIALAEYNSQIPTLADLYGDLQMDMSTVDLILQKAVKDGRVYKLGSKRFVLFKQLRQFAYGVHQLSSTVPRFSVVDVKEHLGLGRNSCIQLLEYFDYIGFTRRYGQRRTVIDKELPDRMFTII